MRFRVGEATEVLSQTPDVLSALLRDKSAAWLNARLAPDSFSPIDVVGHLIHGEKTDWIPRAHFILEHRDTRTFEPFDRFGFHDSIAGRPIGEVLDEFARLRHQSIEGLRALKLSEEQLLLPGMHPELGPVTLGNHLSSWVVHDLGHIRQIVTIMASRYRDDVGPWRAYTSILE